MYKKRLKGGVVATVGYLLSPLSFWNDLFLNIPLAYVFALPFAAISRTLFLPAMITGYWITNIAGFILLHKGAVDVASKEAVRYSRSALIKDLGLSVVYTLVVVLLLKFGILRLPTEYFSH